MLAPSVKHLFFHVCLHNPSQNMPASARVSAYFYLGRTEVSSGHILQGLQLLERAFAECPRDSRNMQTILRFLVPVSFGSSWVWVLCSAACSVVAAAWHSWSVQVSNIWQVGHQ